MLQSETKKYLESFRIAVFDDPLFAAEGLDLDNAQHALDELEASVKKIAKSWKKVIARLFFFKYPPAESAHPIAFLRSFLQSEKLRRVFLADPSVQNAQGLLAQWEETVDNYKEGAQKYRDALATIGYLENIDKNSQIGYFDSAPTFAEIIAWTDLLLVNAERIKIEINEFKLVLSGQRLPHMPKIISQKQESTAKKSTEDPVKTSPRINELLEIIESRFVVKKRFTDIKYKIGHFDGGKIKEHSFSVLIGNASDVVSPLIYILLSDEIFFLNLTKGHFIDMIIYRPLFEHKLPYWYQPATTLYSHLDSTYQAEIATKVDLMQRSFKRPEQILRQKSSLLDLLIGTGIYYNNRFEKLVRIYAFHRKLPQLSFFYFARAYPTIYFLPFNLSVWRIAKSPKLTGTRFGPKSHYEPYSKLHSKVSFEMLKKVVAISSSRSKYFKKELGK